MNTTSIYSFVVASSPIPVAHTYNADVERIHADDDS